MLKNIMIYKNKYLLFIINLLLFYHNYGMLNKYCINVHKNNCLNKNCCCKLSKEEIKEIDAIMADDSSQEEDLFKKENNLIDYILKSPEENTINKLNYILYKKKYNEKDASNFIFLIFKNIISKRKENRISQAETLNLLETIHKYQKSKKNVKSKNLESFMTFWYLIQNLPQKPVKEKCYNKSNQVKQDIFNKALSEAGENKKIINVIVCQLLLKKEKDSLSSFNLEKKSWYFYEVLAGNLQENFKEDPKKWDRAEAIDLLNKINNNIKGPIEQNTFPCLFDLHNNISCYHILTKN